MRRSQTNRQQAGGYTLIELLVVIAIIGLLIALLIPAVQKFRAKGPELATRHEIGQIENAHASFLSTYDVKYIPTCMWLTSNYNQWTPVQSPALNDSRQYYAKVWPKAFVSSGVARIPLNQAIGLDGNQLLLLLLGGIPPGDNLFPTANFFGNRTGFLNSTNNPFNYQTPPAVATAGCYPGAPGTVKDAFYNFDPKRIDANGHYHDTHWLQDDSTHINNNIYYYFSHRQGNDYHSFGQIYANGADAMGVLPGMTPQGGYGPGALLVNPFIGPDGKYINAAKFQIISSGRDHLNGPGGTFPSGQYAPLLPGGDDQSNFSNALLGGTK